LTDAFPSLLCILSAFVFIYELPVLGQSEYRAFLTG
jgi:hypothetical protein